MSDTAQPMLAAENVAINEGADAFKAFLTPKDEQPRDETGKFAAVEQEEEEEIAEPADEADEAGHDEDEGDDEAADEAQPEATPMPKSWGAEDRDVWDALPPEAQAKIAEREGQRDTGLNQKLQEVANQRKAIEGQLAEANANRDQYAQAIDTVLSLVQPQKPTPYDFGYGSENYDRDAYDIAITQYDQQNQFIGNLMQQRQAIAAQQAEEANKAHAARHAEIEGQWFPKLLDAVPELKEPAKSAETVNSIIRYAIESGIPEEAFASPDAAKSLTSAEMLIAWKAMMYDKGRAAAKRVQETAKPAPKPTGPAVKPGVQVSRQSVERNRLGRAQQRLATEGSVEAGAAVFKHYFKG